MAGEGFMQQKAKLTVRVEKQLIEAAKRYATDHRTTVSKLIAEYLRSLANQEDTALTDLPVLQRLTGILPADVSKEEHHAYLTGKYER